MSSRIQTSKQGSFVWNILTGISSSFKLVSQLLWNIECFHTRHFDSDLGILMRVAVWSILKRKRISDIPVNGMFRNRQLQQRARNGGDSAYFFTHQRSFRSQCLNSSMRIISSLSFRSMHAAQCEQSTQLEPAMCHLAAQLLWWLLPRNGTWA